MVFIRVLQFHNDSSARTQLTHLDSQIKFLVDLRLDGVCPFVLKKQISMSAIEQVAESPSLEQNFDGRHTN